MQSTSTIASRIKLLCSLGIDGQILVPALLRELHDVVPSVANTFLWLNKQYSITNIYDESPDAALYLFLSGYTAQLSNIYLLDDLCQFVEWFREMTNRRVWDREVKPFRLDRILSMSQWLVRNESLRMSPDLRSAILTEIELFPQYRELFGLFSECLVHGDLMPSNLLLDTQGRLHAVLDFDDAYVESALFEYTAIARGLCFSPDFKLEWRLFDQLHRNTERALGAISRNAFMFALRYTCFRFFVYISYGIHKWGSLGDGQLWLADLRKGRTLTTVVTLPNLHMREGAALE